MKGRRPLPYWIAGGSESCTLCEVRHVVEMSVRCTGCDRGFCRDCVIVRAINDVCCPDCDQAAVEGD